jgi:Fe-S oxidoreductase
MYGKALLQRDVVQYLLEDSAASGQPLAANMERAPERILYHPSCHAEWHGVKGQSSAAVYAEALGSLLGSEVRISPGCCGESGLGALTSPGIYSALRQRKARQLDQDLTSLPMESPVLVGCPSCKVGLSRILADGRREREVLHSVELLARLSAGPSWQQEALQAMHSLDGV